MCISLKSKIVVTYRKAVFFIAAHSSKHFFLPFLMTYPPRNREHTLTPAPSPNVLHGNDRYVRLQLNILCTEISIISFVQIKLEAKQRMEFGYDIIGLFILLNMVKGHIKESATNHLEYTIVIYRRVCCILQAGEIYYGQLL